MLSSKTDAMSPMRILIVTTFFPPLNAIASLRPYSWAKRWSSQGHDVTVLTVEKMQENAVTLPLPEGRFHVIEVPTTRLIAHLKKGYSETQRSDASPSSRWKQWCHRLFDAIRFRLGIFNSCRMPDFTDLWVRPALKAVKTAAPWDLVVSSSGPYTTHMVAAAIKKRGQAKKWVADYRDSWSDNYIYRGLFPFNLIEKVLERRLLNHVDLITTVSAPFTNQYLKRFPRKPVVTIENGFDPEDQRHLPEAAVFPQDGKFRIVHTGSIYLGKRNPEPLFAAITTLANDAEQAALLDQLELLFVGAHNDMLCPLIERWKVSPWVKTTGLVSRETALAMQRDAHLLLFLPWNDTSVDGVMTGKLFEYLFSGTPIIAVGSQEPEASQRLILQAGAGWVFHDVTSITSFLIEKLSKPQKERCHVDSSFLHRYRRDVLADKLLKAMTR